MYNFNALNKNKGTIKNRYRISIYVKRQMQITLLAISYVKKPLKYRNQEALDEAREAIP